ncbi:FAD binding domain-containing protein [Hirsutella rhossiliensis]|uniref:FAD binding domain-containing protein n=1 Tax=Hirsutella rhossiliensis TaxID=111463 RepID=A0A9P8MQF9_9HYPO|nr:FAD binding domain-containing protein [Hirsutella rhossiliensis]KAH0958301.1 FAD binding domain-containing protein [Hirsutella rhossiliensis]
MPSLGDGSGRGPYDVAVVGSGLGGLAAAIALRRAGQRVTIYERYDFSGEVGASLSCASNGSRFLEEWGVDIAAAKPVVLQSLVRHDWHTGHVTGTYPLGDYRARFGTDYNNFHRIDLHERLKHVAMADEGGGTPAVLKLWHRAVGLDPVRGKILFDNGVEATHDVVVCADGIRSQMRQQLGIEPHVAPSTSCCYRCIIPADRLRELGLSEFCDSGAVEFWGGDGIDKIVMGACSNQDVVSCYCFYPADKNDLREDGWDVSTTGSNLADTFPGLDDRLKTLFRNAQDIKMWRLYNHDPYPYWVKGRCCLVGDAAHPMMPDQAQGACMAIEDAGALGILFSPRYAFLTIAQKLRLYEEVRRPRATRLQEASKRARLDITERIGWSTASDRPGKLTIEEVCGYDMHLHLAELVQGLVGDAAHPSL